MMPSTSDIYSFQKEIPKYYYTEIDAKFTNITRFNAIDIIPIKDFLDSLDYIGYGTTIIVKREGIKKFMVKRNFLDIFFTIDSLSCF